MGEDDHGHGASQVEAVTDPLTSGADLALIASERPDLGAEVAAHPNAYDGLLDWLVEYGSPDAKAAVARRRAPGPPPPLPTPAPAARPHAPSRPLKSPASSATPASPASSDSPASPAPPARRRPHKKLVIGLVAGATVVVLAIVGAVIWVDSFFGGSASPEAAADKALRSAAGLDAVGLFSSLAPSEVAGLRDAFETAGKAPADDSDADYLATLQAFQDSTDIALDGLVYETESLTEDVAIAYLVNGTITIDGDADAMAASLIGLGSQGTTAVLAGYGYSEADISEELADAETQLAAQIADQLPIVWDIGAMVAEARTDRGTPVSPFAVVTVNEGGWYVSPLLSLAELQLVNNGYNTDAALLRGTRVVDAQTFATPEDAASGAMSAMEEFFAFGDLDAIASVMPLPERRLVSIYGGLWIDEEWWRSNNSGTLTVQALDVTSTEDGDRASLDVADLVFSVSNTSSQSDVRASGTCLQWSTQSFDYYGSSNNGAGCLADWPQATPLGLDDAQIIAVREDGGWLISPLATLSGMLTTATDRFAEMAATDRLDTLWASR